MQSGIESHSADSLEVELKLRLPAVTWANLVGMLIGILIIL